MTIPISSGTMSTRLRSLAAPGVFALLCVAWGSGWLALKIGVAALPPLFFAATRFVAAGTVLLVALAAKGELGRLRDEGMLLTLPGALLMVAVNYGLMAWGATRATSGLAAVVNLTTVPLAMAIFGAIYGRARLGRRTGIALVMGSSGLAVLLLLPALAGTSVAGASAASTAVGLAAISVGAACYAWGSILIRRRTTEIPALAASTFQALAGGYALLVVSALVEPWDSIPAAFADPVRLAGWLFLVAISVLSTPAYLWLLARWEPTRVAAYAYICPVIAVCEGVAFGGERITITEIAGALLLGLGAYWALGQARTDGHRDAARKEVGTPGDQITS